MNNSVSFNKTSKNTSFLLKYKYYANDNGVYTEEGQALYGVINIVLGVLIITFNLPVVVSSGVLLRKGHLHPRSTYILLGNVSLADVLVGASTILTAVLNRSASQCSTACLVQIGLQTAPISVSVMTLVFIAVDRYIFILHSMHYRRLINATKVRVGMAFIWLMAILQASMPAFGYRNHDLGFESCYFVTLLSKNLLYYSALFGLVPCIVIAILYSIILMHALRNAKKHNDVNSTSTQEPSPNSPRMFRGNLRKDETFCKPGAMRSDSLSCFASITSGRAPNLGNNMAELKKNTSCPNLISPRSQRYNINNGISEQNFNEITMRPNVASDTKSRKVSKCECLQKCSEKCKHSFATLKRQKQKYTSMVRGIAVVLLTTSGFLLVWIPLSIVMLMYVHCDDHISGNERCIYLRLLLKGPCFVTLVASSMINPFIYAWWHKGFMKAVKNYWRRCVYLAKIKRTIGNSNNK